jgi:hypothetical protein
MFVDALIKPTADAKVFAKDQAPCFPKVHIEMS